MLPAKQHQLPGSPEALAEQEAPMIDFPEDILLTMQPYFQMEGKAAMDGSSLELGYLNGRLEQARPLALGMRQA